MNEERQLPQYMRVYQSVRNDIIDGRLAPGDKLPSIRSFSKEWAVSNITIIKAFDKLKEESLVTTSERSGFFVSQHVTRRIAAKKVGFLSPVPPQDMHRHKEIHVACSKLQKSLRADDHYFSVHLARWAKAGGSHEYLSPQAISEYGLDAVILIHIYNYHYLSSLTKLGIPILILDADASHLGIDSVYFDNTMAAMHMCSKLIEDGHSQILFVGGPQSHVSGVKKKMYYDPAMTQRLDGCRLAASSAKGDHKIDIHCAYAAESRTGEEWSKSTHEYLEQHPEIDVIVAEAPLKLDAKYSNIGQAVFTSKKITNNDSIVAQAICDYCLLVDQAPDVLKQRLENPYSPTVRRALLPQVLFS